MNASWNHVVGALAHIDVIVFMHRFAKFVARQVRNYFIRIHVAASAGAGLKHVDGEVVDVMAVSNRYCRVFDRRGNVGGQQTQLMISIRSGPLHQSQRTNELTR
jgi:hypothetical protein